jgi:hypothetical protein
MSLNACLKECSFSSFRGQLFTLNLGNPDGCLPEVFVCGLTLTRDGSMHTAAEKMADSLRLATARVYRTGSSKGITHRKHAILWLFQVFALTAGLYGCQV